MKALVIGGSGSGKSEYAEGLLAGLAGPKIYLATMESHGEESQRRIARHRKMREEKGFITLEKSCGLGELTLPSQGAVLVECLGNLAANELFSPQGGGQEGALAGLEQVNRQARHWVMVTNDVFGDGVDYDPDAMEYLRVLGVLNAQAAQWAEVVVEVVCGIPIFHKGREAAG